VIQSLYDMSKWGVWWWYISDKRRNWSWL